MAQAKVLEKLRTIQSSLKAPKGQFNKFGNFYYRSCEDILEALKPLLEKVKACLTLHDEIVLVGERVFVKAVARLYDCEDGTWIETAASAREAKEKKGMDESQITGAASSYARKYALNGLFCIDDTRDADTQDNAAGKKVQGDSIDHEAEKLRQRFISSWEGLGRDDFNHILAKYKLSPIEDISKLPKISNKTRAEEILLTMERLLMKGAGNGEL